MAMANELPSVEGAAHPATASGTTQLLERTVLLLLSLYTIAASALLLPPPDPTMPGDHGWRLGA